MRGNQFTTYSLSSLNNTSLVFEDNGEIKGFLLGFISQENPEDSYIHLLCIKNDLRGQNLGSNLVDEFIKIVSSHGCRKVFLDL